MRKLVPAALLYFLLAALVIYLKHTGFISRETEKTIEFFAVCLFTVYGIYAIMTEDQEA